jgi:hypothetical protein
MGYAGASHRIGEVEFVLGSCEGDVEETAFFFEHVGVVGFEDVAVGANEHRTSNIERLTLNIEVQRDFKDPASRGGRF